MNLAYVTMFIVHVRNIRMRNEFVAIISLSGISTNNLAVRIGSSQHRSGGSVVKLNRVVQHKSYNSRRIDYDFALLELAESWKFSNQIEPVALPNTDARIADGTKSLVSGWGNEIIKLIR